MHKVEFWLNIDATADDEWTADLVFGRGMSFVPADGVHISFCGEACCGSGLQVEEVFFDVPAETWRCSCSHTVATVDEGMRWLRHYERCGFRVVAQTLAPSDPIKGAS